MTKPLLGLILLLLCSVANAQTTLFENFEDASITNTAASSTTPVDLTWSGNTGRFQANANSPALVGSYSLRSNTSNTAGAINEPLPSNFSLNNANTVWRVVYRNNTTKTPDDINAPVANYDNWRLWLAASSTTRTSCIGYFLTHKGGRLVLRSVTNQSNNAYVDILSVNISNETTYSVRIVRRADGLWSLFVNTGTGEATALAGSTTNNDVSFTGSTFTLFDSNNTSGNTNAFLWDNYQISQSYLNVECNDNSVRSTNIFAGETNVPIFSFRLTATENVPLKFIYISSSYNALNDGKIKNNTARLIQSDDNDFNTTGDNVDITAQFDQAVVESNAIKFFDNATDGYSISNGSNKYYFIVVDINNPFTGSGTPPPVTFGTSSANTDFNATSGTFQFSANNKVYTNTYNCTKNQSFVALYDWSGANSTAWESNANWLVGGVTPTYPPGQYDLVRIGVNTSVTITNQPVVSDNRFCSAITFGAKQSNVLTVNGVLTSGGDLTVNHGNTATASSGGMPAGTPTFKTTLAGSGTITVASAILGDGTFPASNATSLIANELSVEIANMNVKKDIVLIANIIDNTYAVNAPQFLHRKGTLTLTGQFDRKINGIYPVPYPNKKDSQVGYFTTDHNTGNLGDTRLIIENLNAIKSQVDGIGIDFTNNGSGISTTVYRNNSAQVQTVYPENNSANSIAIGEADANYQNIEFEGSGPKRFFLNGYNASLPITIGGNWTSSGGKIDLTTSNTTIQFQGGNQTLIDNNSDNGAGVVFKNVRFTNNGIKSIQVGNFAVASTGTLAMANTAQLAAAGKLTLKSDIGSSASVLPIPSGALISENVNVERFISGSSSDLSKRGYRLISSAVSTASPAVGGAAVRTYDPNYLLNSAFVSGLSGGGFNTTGNPTLYLYREDLVPTGVSFTSSNYKGIAALSTATPFAVRTQTRLKTNYTSDTTVNIPIGTGMLFFFRGDKTNNPSQSGTKLSAPFDYPEDVTFTATGTLNQGTVNVRSWYAQADQTKLSYTSTIANNVSPRDVRGYQLLGNPYPSSINWNKINRNGTNSSIYASAIDGPTIWFFNPTNKQYASYLPSGTPDTLNAVSAGTNGASNLIASGQGFFVRASAPDGTFRFMEAAKTTTQPAAASLSKLMGIPLSSVPGVQPYLRLQMKKDSINDDDILIRFDGAFSDEYNPAEDAGDMGGNGALLSLSAFSRDKLSKLSIDGVPGFDKVRSVPLFVDATTSGLYELNRLELVGAPEVYQVWLKDHFTKDSLDLRGNKTYAFRIDKSNTATFGDDRFELVFRRRLLAPYELLSLTAEKTDAGGVTLKWRTLNEYIYTGFTIERSDASGNFVPLTEMQSDGKGSYTLFDPAKVSGSVSYRILQDKPDGTKAYSPIVKVTETIRRPFFISPNPAADYLTVQLDHETEARLRVIDMRGRLIHGTSFSGNGTRINISSLKAGAYIIEVTDNISFKILGKEKWLKL